MHEISALSASELDHNLIKTITGFESIKSEYPDYLSDESKLQAQPFDRLFFPSTEAELSAVLREMNRQNIPVTIAGARTGLVGGCVPQGGALIALEKLDQILKVYFEESSGEWRVCLQPAVSLNTLIDFLKKKHAPQLENHSDLKIQRDFSRFKQDAHHYFYPPDPTELNASIGGTVATNASGASAYRFGATRNWVRGIRVTLATGEVLDIPRGKYFTSPDGQFLLIDSQGRSHPTKIPDYIAPKTKNAAGLYAAPQMDLIDLFIGSEGILGVITQIEIALLKRKNNTAMIQFLDTEEQAINLAGKLRSNPCLVLNFLEFYSQNSLELLRTEQKDGSFPISLPEIPQNAKSALFFDLDFNPDTVDSDLLVLEETISECGGDITNSWAGFDERDMESFKAFRHRVPETINRIIAERKKYQPEIHKLGTDLAVPDEHLAQMWELYSTRCNESGLEWYAFGHIGSNHIHVNILPRDMGELHKGLDLFDIFTKKAVALGGTVSAEHGIGKIKHQFFQLMYSPEQIDQMRRVKAAFDPKGILNRNDMLPFEPA